MTADGILSTIVELSVAVAGFSGVVAALALAQLANAALIRAEWICVGALALYAVIGFGYFILLVQMLWGVSPAVRHVGVADDADVEHRSGAPEDR